MNRAPAVFVVGVVLAACSEVVQPPTSPLLREVRAPNAAAVTPSGVTYTTVDLGLFGGYAGEAIAINDAGQVAFYVEKADFTRGIYRWQAGVATELPSIGGRYSYPWSINAAGDIVGWSSVSGDGFYHAALWTGGTVTDLGALPGDGWSWATDVNEQGQVIGSSQGGVDRAWIWQNGVMTELPGLSRRQSTDAVDINRHGDVVGWSANRAALWRGGVLTVLTDLPFVFNSQAFQINDAGQIAGVAEYGSGSYRAVRWTNGVPTDLGDLGGGRSTPIAMNERGDVVGWSSLPDGNSHAFLWRDGVMIDLGDLGSPYPYSIASDVNDRGQVTGAAMRPDGSIHAFLWENGVMTDLGTLGGRFSGPSTSRSMNNSGAIVGSSQDADNLQHPALWDPNSVKAVTIDIKPGSTPNSVNPKSKGVIPVAILSVAGFDATTVDVATVKFGPGNAAEAHGKGHIEDANGDGIMDMVLHFDTQASGIACGATSATLTGKTLGGQQIKGSDAVMTVGCK